MKPDVVLVRGGQRIVIDTKWKRLSPLGHVGTDPKCGVDQADVYQLMAYAQAYEADTVVLLYPALAPTLGFDRLHLVGTNQSLVLAELPIESLEAVPELLGRLIGMALEEPQATKSEPRPTE